MGATENTAKKFTGWQSKITGSYKSAIFNGDTEYTVKTAFKTDGGAWNGKK